MASGSNIAQALTNALQGTIAPDTNVIKAATKQLTSLYNNPQSLPALFEIGTTSQNPAIRQLALVELRKRVTAKKAKHWVQQPQPVRTAIKARLLETVVSEQSAQVRTAATRCISTIARLELPNKTWPELLPWVWSLIQDESPANREVALQCLFALLDTVIVSEDQKPGEITHHIPQLLNLFQKTLADSSQAVRVWTVKALGKLSDFLEVQEEVEVTAFQQLVPGIVQVIQQALDADDEPAVKAGLDVIESITFAEAPLLTPHIPALVQFLLTTGSNTNYDSELRIALLNALLWVVKFKKGRIQALNLATPILHALLPIGAEAEPADHDEDSPARTAFRVIDVLATSLPPAQVFPPLFEQVRQYASSSEPLQRKSAITAFGVVVEGCSLFIQPHLENLWPLVEGALADSDVRVRKAGCSALGCLCEMLEDECAKRHKTLLPLIFKLVGDQETQRSALVALDCLLEVLGSDIEPYIPSLMESLLTLLDSATLQVKSTVVGAIGSAAHASKAKFAPYFEAAIHRILPFLRLTEEGEELELRGIAQDTVGTLAEAVGKEAFRPYYEPCLKIAYEATMADLPKASNLKECSYIFFAVISRVFGEEFATQLPVAMPLLLAAIQQGEIDDGLLAGDGVEDVDETALNGDGGDFEDIDSDEEIGSDDDAEALINASTAIAIEKECAIDAVGEIFTNVKQHFLPYLEPSINALLPGLAHDWHDGIRKASASALLGFVSTFYTMTAEGKKWKKGGSNFEPLPNNVMQLVNHIVPAILEMWNQEEDRDVVNELCVAFSGAIMSVGPGLIVPTYVQPLCEHLDLILQRKAACQLADAEDEDEVATGEQSEYDAALIASACDLVGSLASVLGADFAQAFPTFLPGMAQYYAPEKTVGDRSTAIGSLAECVNGMESAVTPFTDSLFPLFLRSLSDPEAEVQSNGAFAIGSLIYHSSTDLSAQYITVLQHLQPLFRPEGDETGSKQQNALDNACGAVARLMLKNSSALPMDQVVPVFVQALPLRRDFAESEKVYEALFNLVQTQNPQAVERIDHILKVFAVGLESGAGDRLYPDDEGAQLSRETRAQTIEFLKAINASAPEKVQSAGLSSYLS